MIFRNLIRALIHRVFRSRGCLEEECKLEKSLQSDIDCRNILPRQRGKPFVSKILTIATGMLPEEMSIGYKVYKLWYNCLRFAPLYVVANRSSVGSKNKKKNKKRADRYWTDACGRGTNEANQCYPQAPRDLKGFGNRVLGWMTASSEEGGSVKSTVEKLPEERSTFKWTVSGYKLQATGNVTVEYNICNVGA